jgi:hypothetical protein
MRSADGFPCPSSTQNHAAPLSAHNDLVICPSRRQAPELILIGDGLQKQPLDSEGKARLSQ